MSHSSHSGWYDRWVLPWLVDLVCSTRLVRRQRRKVVPLAQGEVLEIGIGTGLNLAHYDKSRVERVVGLDPGQTLRRRTRKRMQRSGLRVELHSLPAERIPFADASFDTVLVTYSLCTIPEPLAALREMRRVLRPEGRLIFCEHGLAPDAAVQHWQHRLTPLWARMGGGCHLDRDIPALLRQAGFRIVDLQAEYLPGPRLLTYNYWGMAVAA